MSCPAVPLRDGPDPPGIPAPLAAVSGSQVLPELLALVRYTLESTDGQGVQLLHYMPADLVTRRSPRSTRRAK